MKNLKLVPFQKRVGRPGIRLLVAIGSLFGILNLAASPQRIMVSASKPDHVLVFQLDGESGLLKLVNKQATSASPGSMCFSENGDYLYVSLKNPGAIASFEMGDGSTLKPIGRADTGAYAGYVSMHRSGAFLLSSYFRAGQVAAHRIQNDGSLSKDPIQVIQTDNNAHAAVSDPSGDFLFVPHTRPNKIYQFSVNASSGELSTSNPPFLIRDPNTGPRHLWFHPHLDVAYGSDEQGSSISVYTLNRERGTLSLVETLSSLPHEFGGKNSTSDIEVHPSGRFVYIANRGHNSIATFAIGEADGALTFREHTSVDPVPRSFNITPDGDFLIVAGQQTNSLGVFRIKEGGELVLTQSILIEGDPWWVVCQPQ